MNTILALVLSLLEGSSEFALEDSEFEGSEFAVDKFRLVQ